MKAGSPNTPSWKDVAHSLIRNKGGTFLIGAGCSVTSGIPAARGIVEYAKACYPGAAEEPATEYPTVLKRLPWNARYGLFHKLNEVAAVNWGHLALAWLMHQKLARRVLTTNFDDLLLRACALLGVHPSTHDLALFHLLRANAQARIGANELFRESLVREPAVFYLHGRHNGFAQLHSADQVYPQAESLIPIVRHCKNAGANDGHGGTWVIIGYSGDSDPLMDALRMNAPFSQDLFWVNRSKPSTKVQRFLKRQEGRFVQIEGADEFLVQVVRGVGGSVTGMLRAVLGYPVQAITELRATNPQLKLPKPLVRRGLLRRIGRGELPADVRRRKLMECHQRNDFLAVIRRGERHPLEDPKSDALVALSHCHLGDAALAKGRLEAALRRYTQAWQVVPLGDRALRTWRETLQAKGDPDERRAEWRQALRYYNGTNAHAADCLEVLERWAGMLSMLAETERPLSKNKSLEEAARALKNFVEEHSVRALTFLILGDVLLARARRVRGRNPKILTLEACAAYAKVAQGVTDRSALRGLQGVAKRLRCGEPCEGLWPALQRIADRVSKPATQEADARWCQGLYTLRR